MKKYQISSYQNDLNRKKNYKYLYKTIYFNKIDSELENILIKEIKEYFNNMKINKASHILIVGLGKDYHTPDSVGPNTLKYLNINAYLENLNIKINYPKVSSFKPGVLGETGILTEKTIKSIVKEIKPNLVIIIDSLVSDNIKDLNHTIEINNQGINPGNGIFGIKSVINENLLHTKILVIGVTTALLVKLDNNNEKYLLSTKDILDYVGKISKLIAGSINKAIDYLRKE